MSKHHIETCVKESLRIYFKDLRGTDPHNVYDMVMQAAEKPLLDFIMQEAGNNQSQAAQWLGLNRNTLHKKLLQYGLLK